MYRQARIHTSNSCSRFQHVNVDVFFILFSQVRVKKLKPGSTVSNVYKHKPLQKDYCLPTSSCWCLTEQARTRQPNRLFQAKLTLWRSDLSRLSAEAYRSSCEFTSKIHSSNCIHHTLENMTPMSPGLSCGFQKRQLAFANLTILKQMHV